MARLGESLSSVLDGLEELGLEGIPASMEYDLRHAMDLHSPTPTTVTPRTGLQDSCSVASCPESSSLAATAVDPQHLDLLPSEEELVEELFRSGGGGGGGGSSDDLASFVRAATGADRFQEL